MSTKSTEITATEAASRLGITAQAVGAWASKPDAPARKDGTRVLVRWPAFARWREERLIAQAKAEAAPPDLLAAQTRRALAQAELAELEVGKARGEWVSVEDYETALGRMLDYVMAQLRALPVRLSHFGPEVEAAVEAEVERTVLEMHDFDEDVFPVPAPEQETAA